MNSLKLIISFSVSLFITVGCSVYMAANQADKKDVHVLDKGTPRSHVMAELGKPLYTKNKDGRTCDVFSFVQGYGKGAKAGRALFHGAADVFTLGLWEVVGTPVEAIADGNNVQVEVYYDAEQYVEFIKVIEGEDQLKKVNSVTSPTEPPTGPAEQPESIDNKEGEIAKSDLESIPEFIQAKDKLRLAVFPFHVDTVGLKYVSSVEETVIYALSHELNENKTFIVTNSYYDLGIQETIKPLDEKSIPSGDFNDLWVKTTFSPKTPNLALICEIGKRIGSDVVMIASVDGESSYTIAVEYYLINVESHDIFKKSDKFGTSRFQNEIYGFTQKCFGSYKYLN